MFSVLKIIDDDEMFVFYSYLAFLQLRLDIYGGKWVVAVGFTRLILLSAVAVFFLQFFWFLVLNWRKTFLEFILLLWLGCVYCYQRVFIVFHCCRAIRGCFMKLVLTLTPNITCSNMSSLAAVLVCAVVLYLDKFSNRDVCFCWRLIFLGQRNAQSWTWGLYLCMSSAVLLRVAVCTRWLAVNRNKHILKYLFQFESAALGWLVDCSEQCVLDQIIINVVLHIGCVVFL